MSARLRAVFTQRAYDYWRAHPQEWRDTLTGRDAWDGLWWTLVVHRLGDGESFGSWLTREVSETHVRDQMWSLIKDTAPDLYRVYFHHDQTPLQCHRGSP